MRVERNSVWSITDIDGVDSGVYRVLELFYDINILVLFNLEESGGLRRPIKIDSSRFLCAIKGGAVKRNFSPLPYYQLADEGLIPEAHIKKRDRNIELISELIENPDFLLEISTEERSKVLVNQAKSKGVRAQRIYRLLNQYWRGGQERNALLPAYKNSGGAGRVRVSGGLKRGAPIRMLTPSMEIHQGVNTSENDKNNFILAMKKYGLKGRRVPFSQVYEKMLKELYSQELILAESESRSPNVPSYRTFIYWVKKLIPKNEIIRKQTTVGDFERNKRGLRGAATDHTEVPGSCFELDSTVLDVHIVSEFRRSHVLGRPTVYCVVDKESRMIVGLHVSMEYASWRAGRQALVNSFTDKKSYCSRFGIEIEDHEWPCHHIPQRLLCDRGEFICKSAEKLAVPLIGHLSIAPPYRADLKGIVERRFEILNKNLVHELLGTTRGHHYIRGDRDPRLDATYTLDEVTKLLIDEVMEHNNSLFDGLAAQSVLLVQNGLPPTPLNYWNIHLKKHRHALSRSEESEVRAKLLPAVEVSMTSKGIRLNEDMYYECDREEFQEWKVLARSTKCWKMEARIDQDNSSFIYVRLKEREGFTKCNLMKFSASLSDKHQADILYFKDWKKKEKCKNKPGKKSIERHNRRKLVSQVAKSETKKDVQDKSKTERIKGMRTRRKEAVLDRRIEYGESIREEKSELYPDDENLESKRKNEAVSLIKRKRRNQ
ncbi:DDE-type integrase/transposase/recombinase [Microbulbifer sp. EKSA008]|uniref:DDE-type integrase/transposase/recombinase n=1 Tax=unclassified Microbulbifer TaxID=2619833 RepID=UPI00126883EC|nr:DDE-type integrase/transposase/recombinase [Microbulbifer sp. VAAF005]QFT55946.1 Transposon Tn7 transposition protein TnsB [Microbulbifer sp. THAF38]WHI48255.1 DDE-type integrase/transposase/recombinase [Microbulbifer sp. VAAF005]